MCSSDLGGNPFEAPRARDYPLPPLTPILSSEVFSEAARNAGYHPFPRPSANASRAYTNPDGSKFGACQYCGFCERFGCEANAKASPHFTMLPLARKNPNFELRTLSRVLRVNLDSTGKRAVSVTYMDARGREFEPFDRSLDVQVSRLRKMIEPDPSQPRYIELTPWLIILAIAAFLAEILERRTGLFAFKPRRVPAESIPETAAKKTPTPRTSAAPAAVQATPVAPTAPTPTASNAGLSDAFRQASKRAKIGRAHV